MKWINLTGVLLRKGENMRVKYDIDTQLVFQIGDPIAHSTAAFLHNAMYDLANVNAVCMLVKVPKGGLPDFLQAVKTLNANGFDITTPHKTDIIQYLDECDEASRIFNCVNHVKYRDGKLIGIGLDGVGMGGAIEANVGDLTGANVLLLGAGAVAGPIAADVVSRGAKKVFIANRTVEKADTIAANLQKLYKTETETGTMDDDFLAECAKKVDIVIQCTSIGMYGHPGKFKSLEFMKELKKDAFCADVLYPKTEFLDKATELGLRNINGMGMLLHQQIAMIDFRFGIKLDPSCLKMAEESLTCAVALRTLREQRNVLK